MPRSRCFPGNVTFQILSGVVAPEAFSGNGAFRTSSDDVAPELVSGDVVLEVSSDNIVFQAPSGDAAIEMPSGDVALGALPGDVAFETPPVGVALLMLSGEQFCDGADDEVQRGCDGGDVRREPCDGAHRTDPGLLFGETGASQVADGGLNAKKRKRRGKIKPKSEAKESRALRRVSWADASEPEGGDWRCPASPTSPVPAAEIVKAWLNGPSDDYEDLAVSLGFRD